MTENTISDYKFETYVRFYEVSTGEHPVTIYEFDQTQTLCKIKVRLNASMKRDAVIRKSEKHYENDIKNLLASIKDWQTAKK